MTKKVLLSLARLIHIILTEAIDRDAFDDLCKPSSAPIFRMPFRPRDLGIGSPIAELSIGPPLAELEG